MIEKTNTLTPYILDVTGKNQETLAIPDGTVEAVVTGTLSGNVVIPEVPILHITGLKVQASGELIASAGLIISVENVTRCGAPARFQEPTLSLTSPETALSGMDYPSNIMLKLSGPNETGRPVHLSLEACGATNIKFQQGQPKIFKYRPKPISSRHVG